MKLKALVAALALAAAGSSMAATFDLGPLGPPGFAEFGNSFTTVQNFSDTFTFSLASDATAGGLIGTFDVSFFLRDVALSSLSLTGAGLSSTLTDFSTGRYSFSNLTAGSYQMQVTGQVTGVNGGFAPVGYGGTLSTVAAPVPEPETLAMMALGLGAVGFAARRRKQKNA